MDYFAGIDIGSGSTKGLLSDSRGIIISKVNILHNLNVDANGKSEASADILFLEVVQVILDLLKSARASANKLKCISISGFESVTFLDRNGKEARPSITYLDSRSERVATEFAERVGEDLIFEKNKNRPSSIFEGYKAIWALNNFKTRDRTVKLLDVAKYSVFRLTGQYTMDFSTGMLFAPFYNQAKDQWDEDMMKLAGVKPDILPELAESESIVGTISKESNEKYGLSPETLVTVGTQDAYASLLADGVMSDGESSFIYGTSGVFDFVHDGNSFSNLFANTRHVIKGKYVAEAAMYNSGSLLNWFGKNSRRKLRELDRIAEKRKRPGQVMAIPFFSGERAPIWNNRLRGGFLNVTFETDFFDLYVALMESIGYWVKYVLENARNSKIEAKSIVSSGGGTKSSIWPQIISDVIGLDQEIKVSEGATQGDIFLSLKASDLIDNFDEIIKTVKTEKQVKSDISLHRKYLRKYKKFESMLNEPNFMTNF